ncbi:MAG TPA: tetratricopeptide repeat protein [Gemmatimonadaceae bacterium]
MTEPTSPVGVPAEDPEQLTLGDFGSAFTPPVGEKGRGGDRDEGQGETAIAVREPPVCGEYSFDVDDEAEGRGGATFVGPVAEPSTMRSRPVENPPNVAGSGAAKAASRPAAPVPRTPTSRSLRTPMAQRALTPPTPLPALADLKSIHEANPADAKIAVALAGALDKRGNIEGALSVLLKSMEAGADAVAMRCARATILSNRLRYDDAEAELKKAAKLRGDDPDVLLQQGILACARAKWRDAVMPLEHLAKLNPRSVPAHYHLGEALNKLDRLEEALAAYELASELEPGNWRALKGVGIVLDRMGRPADAAAFYRRARDAQGG